MNVTKQLYQWDTGQKLTECTGIYVDYLIGDEVYRVEITDGTCIIPDELLQTSGRYKVWECMADNTLREFAFKVLPRPIPPNYVFTPTEQLTFEGLVQKETNKFNTNAIEKLNAYNANADNRVAEFNAQTEQIQTDVSELKSDLVPLIDEGFEIEYTSIDLTVYEKKQGYYRYDNAQYQDVTYLEYYDIPVQSGDKYKVIGTNSGLSNILLLLDSSGNKVLAYPNVQDNNAYSHEFVVPYNAVRMILGGVVSTLVLFNGEYKPKGISEIRDSIGELKYSYMDITDEVYENHVNGYINRTTGNITSDSSSISSDFQHVNVGDKFKITGFSRFSTCGYAFYDQYKSFISSGAHDNGNAYQFIDYEIIIPENVAFVRFCNFSTGSYKVKRYQKESIAYTQNDLYSKLEEVNQLCKKSNVLYGKKLVACGDSFTAGDFTGYVDKDGNTGTSSDAYDKTLKMYKTYPWWIAQRNDMTLINEARNGSDFTNVTGSSSPFSLTRYLEVPTDADYITLMFGLNETGLTDEEIGSNTDTTNATLWGAYNIVFEHFMTNMPYAKIGVIIADAWMTERYANAVKQICEYWGVPVLDLKFDTSIPLGIGGRPNGSETAKELRNGVFQVTETNSHPSLKAHEYRSTIIEDWLRHL